MTRLLWTCLGIGIGIIVGRLFQYQLTVNAITTMAAQVDLLERVCR